LLKWLSLLSEKIQPNELIADLSARGLVAQMTGDGDLEAHLSSGSRTLYCGFDPTADSLHIGSLVPLLTLKRFQLAGHRPIALVGGATGLIGDPSFKADERKLNTPDVVATWVDKIKSQVSQFIDFDGEYAAEVVNNLDWTSGLSVLDFLRDVGKHFSINGMINKESVKQRINREGAGISFTAFSYMLLQSMDFAERNKRNKCTLQIGGSDQWGNITGGIDLTRRQNSEQVFGLTLPLVTKSDGTKFGKTESGTIWLDPAKTSPYAFYQFWLNTADADAYKFLNYFTFLSVAEIAEIQKVDEEAQGRPQAQSILAKEVTALVHGEEGLNAALRITDALFSGNADQLSEADYNQLKQDGLPFASIANMDLASVSLVQVLTDAGLAPSGKPIKDALSRNAIVINGVTLGMDSMAASESVFAKGNARFDQYFLVKMGKKKYALLSLG
jgi:tyrosyl-tRNA synthetase